MCVYITNILQLIINTFCSLWKTNSVAGLIYSEIQKSGILSNICRHTWWPLQWRRNCQSWVLKSVILIYYSNWILGRIFKQSSSIESSKTTVMTMVYLVQYLSIIYDMYREHTEHTIPQLDTHWLLNSNCHNYFACIFSWSLLECLKHSESNKQKYNKYCDT